MPHNALNYTKCVVIVHGKSEFALVKYIYTNLHLPVKIIAKDKGRGSIQINGLSEYLRKKQFRTLNEYEIGIKLVDVVVSGSRCRGLEQAGSNLDIVVEYKGRENEDDLFNAFNEEGRSYDWRRKS